MYEDKGFSTKAIHYGQPPDPFYGSLNVPIHLTSTYAQRDCADPFYKFDYGRGGNPTREALESWLASLENGKYGLATSSGVSSIMLVIHLLKSGDHVIVAEDLYGGTTNYLNKYAVGTYAMEVSYIDMSDHNLLKESIKSNTKLVWIESPTNPLLKWFDINAISEICKEHNLIFVVDNTFMSPYNQKPLDLGADIVMHSCTKYLGGHADIIMGALITSNKDIYEKLYFLLYAIGSTPSPFDW